MMSIKLTIIDHSFSIIIQGEIKQLILYQLLSRQILFLSLNNKLIKVIQLLLLHTNMKLAILTNMRSILQHINHYWHLLNIMTDTLQLNKINKLQLHHQPTCLQTNRQHISISNHITFHNLLINLFNRLSKINILWSINLKEIKRNTQLLRKYKDLCMINCIQILRKIKD